MAGRPPKYTPELFEIYGLYDPITGKLMYIGKANDSQKRLKSHLRDCQTRNTPVYIWVKSLLEKGLRPEIRVLETTENWKEAEIRLIEKCKSSGIELLNVAKGGSEPFCSKEVRATNGRNNARSIHDNHNSKRLWSLKHNLGITLKFLRKNGLEESADRIVKRLYSKGIVLA